MIINAMTAASRWPRWRWLAGVAIANALVLGLVAAPTQAQVQTARGPSLCSGVAENIVIVGRLAVPAGATCDLINSRVIGSVEVRADANLFLTESRVHGTLTVRSEGFVHAVDSRVDRVTRLRSAFGAVADGSTLGRVDARSSGFYLSDGTTHRGQVSSRDGQTVVLASRVNGNLRTTGDLLTDLRDTVVTGRLDVNQAEVGAVVCESEIDRQASVRNSGGLVQLGGDFAVADCPFNVFGSSVTLRANDATIDVSDNVIRGDLVCTDNASTPTGSGNRVRGELVGQCADLAPAGPALASATVDPDAQLEALRQQIDERVAAGLAEAAAIGPADL